MLHPQARALIDLIAQRGLPPMQSLSPVEARLFYRDRRALTQPESPPVAEISELSADGAHGPIPLRLYRPTLHSDDRAALPVLVYYHGGGWTIGDLDTHDVLCRQLANGSGCAVVSVDYRMGPEHRFPAGSDDCLAATYWVRRHAEALGLDASRLAVGGDSAGGNLAAAALPAGAAESVGQAASSAATRSGHAVGEAGRKVGHAVADDSRKVGHAVAEDGRKVGHAAAEGGRKTGAAAKKGGRKVKAAAQSASAAK